MMKSDEPGASSPSETGIVVGSDPRPPGSAAPDRPSARTLANAISAKDVIAYSGKGKANGNLSTRAVAAEFLTTLLMWGARKAEEVFQEGRDCGLSKMTLKRASIALDVVKRRVGFGKGSWMEWTLPEGHPALAVAASAKGVPDEDEGDELEFDFDAIAVIGDDAA